MVKITGASEQPQNLIRRFKNEAFPNVAVTVELLSTGVDVPAIGNIVFLRRMNSRILYDQMIGRATRLCEPIGKSHFRIFDAVGIYNTLQPFSQMRPVVVNPSISFSQLLGELSASDDPDDAQLIRQQLVGKAAPQAWPAAPEPGGTLVLAYRGGTRGLHQPAAGPADRGGEPLGGRNRGVG